MSDKEKKEFLDLRGVVCPMNFVKTKLKLESMEDGEVLDLVLDAGEPIQNVPKSLKDEGYKISGVKKADDHFTLTIKKGDV